MITIIKKKLCKSNKFGWKGENASGVRGLYSKQDLDYIDKISSNCKDAVIVGGGLKDNFDLEKLRMIQSDNLEGVIAGKSFYVGNIDLKEAQKILSGNA